MAGRIQNFKATPTAWTVVRAAALILILALLGSQVPADVHAGQKRTGSPEDKTVRMILGPLTAQVVNAHGRRRTPAMVFVVLTANDPWTGRLCEFSPRLIDAAVGYFDIHPLTQDMQGKTSTAFKPTLLESMNASFEKSSGVAAITGIDLQERLEKTSVKAQAKTLRADYLCTNGAAEKL